MIWMILNGISQELKRAEELNDKVRLFLRELILKTHWRQVWENDEKQGKHLIPLSNW